MADLAGAAARVKWPNDVLLDGRKLAGVLVEARPQSGWAVLGIGVNVALDTSELPLELRAGAATLGRPPGTLEETLDELLGCLQRRLVEPPADCLAALRARDALIGRPVRWAGGEGTGDGIDDAGALLRPPRRRQPDDARGRRGPPRRLGQGRHEGQRSVRGRSARTSVSAPYRRDSADV